jgi:deoxycytidylate deaminase
MIPRCPRCDEPRALESTVMGPMCPVCHVKAGVPGDRSAASRREDTIAQAVTSATIAAGQSPCQKSKRGVCVFEPRFGILASGYNTPPPGYACDGSQGCREHCAKLCNHAELEALRLARQSRMYMICMGSLELLHIKVRTESKSGAQAVPSGPPSCWQCSRAILAEDIQAVWLLHEDQETLYLRGYTAHEFHAATLAHLGLPSIPDLPVIHR